MRISKSTLLQLVVAGTILVIFCGLAVNRALHAPLKFGRIKTDPGISTALKQIHFASIVYWSREATNPTSLDALAGIRVLDSEGNPFLFAKEKLSKELSADPTLVAYFPEFMAVDFGVPTDEIVLAYIAETNAPNFYQVVHLDGKIRRINSLELEKKIAHLRSKFTNR